MDSNLAIAQVQLWSADGTKSERVAGPLDWTEAVKKFRLRQFDLMWRDEEGRWYGYRLRPPHEARREDVYKLTEEAYAFTLQRSIA